MEMAHFFSFLLEGWDLEILGLLTVIEDREEGIK